MKTNKLIVKTDFEVLNQKFVFLRFEWQEKSKKQSWANSYHLDKIIAEQRAEACLFRYGRFAYALFKRKNVKDPDTLRQKIALLEGFENICVSIVYASEEKSEDNNVIIKNWLYQLLLNAVMNSPIESLAFHNLSGKCFLVPLPLKKKDCFTAFELLIDEQSIFNIQAVTFRKKIAILQDPDDKTRQFALCKPTYLINGNRLERDFSRDNHSYIGAGKRGTHSTTEAINISTLSKFIQSRLGILHLIKEKFNRYYQGMVELEWSERPVEQQLNQRFRLLNEASHDVKKLHRLLQNMPIILLDKVQEEKSYELILDIQQQLTQLGFYAEIAPVEQQGKSHLCLIKQPKDYEQDKDPYQQDKNYTRQHLSDTLYLAFYQEDLAKGSNKRSILLKNLLKELWIKQDVQQKKISLFDTHAFIKGKWIFGTVSKDKEKNIDLLILEQDGSFSYEQDNVLFPSRYHKLLQPILDWLEQHKRKDLESFVISEQGDINLIFQKGEVVLPELDLIHQELVDLDKALPKPYQYGYQLADELAKAEIAKSEKLIMALNEITEPLTKKQLSTLLREYARRNKAIREYLRTLGIVLSFSKTQQNLMEKMGDLFCISAGVTDEKNAWYSVGFYTESLQQHLPHLVHLREVVAIKGKHCYPEILPLVDVDFVRFKNFTVQPFPLKYLRECQHMYGSQNNEMEFLSENFC